MGIRGWEEFLCFIVELFKINLLLTHNIKVFEFISEQLWKWEKIQSQAGFFLEYFINKNLRLISTLATN
ncbi:hypothetical protein BpHYR1_046024 [Brachionus plicatilis]|uniref:Uncharacterized protein n=1 Tax=Brachionus plicatilis TaxID=10195 RepID=A0A3M7Q807_BRAPC|nr:hypothetical protein BpHYR1_046024 [Brachionus plicatilis]